MLDPIGILALARAQFISEDVEEQLTARAREGFRPLAAILHKAKLQASEAIARLVDVGPREPERIMELQNEVRRFADLVRFTREILSEGKEHQVAVDDAERDALEQLIFSPSAEATAEQLAELRRLGLYGDNAYGE